MSQAKVSRLPTKIGWCVGILFLGVSLLPFTFVGESWGMVWFYVAAPISMVVEATVGIGRGSYLLVGLTSVMCATLWAALAYALTKMTQR